MYTLLENDSGEVLLDIVVGGIAMNEVSLPLSYEEVGRYHDEGKTYIDELASDVSRNNLTKYADRLRPSS